MIHVQPAREPADFDATVRQPGLRAIAEMVGKTPATPRTDGNPCAQRKRILKQDDGTSREVPITDEADLPATEFPTFWRHVLPQLMEAYHNVCAYSCFAIHEVTGGASVDHMAPKSRAWNHVYEWDNYRLACQRLNARKRDFSDVLDPFEIEDGWFVLDLLSFKVKPAPSLDPARRQQVQDTIDRLGLDDFRQRREKDARRYRTGQISLDVLIEESPFVAMELRRQGLLNPPPRPSPASPLSSPSPTASGSAPAT